MEYIRDAQIDPPEHEDDNEDADLEQMDRQHDYAREND